MVIENETIHRKLKISFAFYVGVFWFCHADSLNRLHYIESQITPACLPSTNSASSEIKFFEYKDTCIPVHVPI